MLRIYLHEALEQAQATHMQPDTVLLGCTHYPLLRPLLERTLPESMRILDSAATTAESVHRDLQARSMLPAQVLTTLHAAAEAPSVSRCHFYATDSIEKFQRLGSRFLGQAMHAVTLMDIGG